MRGLLDQAKDQAMTFLCEFTVEGEPVAKGRPRFSRRGQHVVAYTPGKTIDYELHVKDAAMRAMGSSEPLDGPVALSVRVFVPIPASWSKKRQEAANNQFVVKKPDGDNYLKAVMDACNGVLYVDDSQVADFHCSKKYSTFPRVEVTLVELVP
jgi:Holliday junction resolvase RusA-like endonuclease